MDDNLPVIYLSGLLIFVAGLAIFVLIQIVRTRRFEGRFSRLQKKLKEEKGTAKEYYELGSMFLDKKLYVQAINLLQKALKAEGEIDPENKALIYNALGFSYYAQEQYELAIRNYKDAIKLYPQYVIALNNLANIYEKKQMSAKALETYEETLKYEPQNSIAKRRAESLRKRFIAQR
ncbi:tetratricopeptide repeat protein [Chroococcus sp. FPU101]|uniref:tetratricopeptide repeat protein n=1 Tax=Chroococcus sp. FPU101 TaxID=1974212 RepID=UPI001A8D1393|nr:tetratricopeptide repeat protein [Chroococcus sp. FPU101]GFE69172.1 photosystem I assembly related protein Ycf37 [Chroococcus sp. FPU101]